MEGFRALEANGRFGSDHGCNAGSVLELFCNSARMILLTIFIIVDFRRVISQLCIEVSSLAVILL